MADDLAPARGRRGMGFIGGMLGRPPQPVWTLEVVGTAQVTPHMFGVDFTGATLGDLVWRPGQDLVLSLPDGHGGVARRHYTIRGFDARTRRMRIDFVLHEGDSPAGRWALAAKPGDRIEAQGPRGRTSARDAQRHLFLGDESCIPAIFAIAETLPAGVRATALIEVDGPADAQPLPAVKADVEVEWFYRNGAPAGPSEILLKRLLALAPRPEGCHAYVIGETSNVRAQRHALLAMGFDREQTTAEGYWRPGRIGGHDHV